MFVSAALLLILVTKVKSDDVFRKTSVLFTGMHISDSHVGSMLPSARSLHDCGFDVHYLETHVKEKGFNFKFPLNHTYIKLPDEKDFDAGIFVKMWNEMLSPTVFPLVWNSGENSVVRIYEDQYKEIVPILDTKYDLVIVDDLFAMLGYGLSLKKLREHSTPYIIYSTTVPTFAFEFWKGYGFNVVHRPTMYLPPWKSFNFESFESRLQLASHEIVMGFGVRLQTSYVLTRGMELMGVPEFSMPTFFEKASFYFKDDLNRIAFPSPTGHDEIAIGAQCTEHISNGNQEEFDQILNDKTSKGTIFIAFGTHVPWKYAPKYITDSYVHALNQFKDYRVIFSFNGEPTQIENLGSHVVITKWAPQNHILHHNNTKLFISHGGLKSLKEALCSATPILFMPLFAEQPHNAEMARHLKIGDIIDKTSVTGESMTMQMKNLLENPCYQNNVERIRSIMLDRPMDIEKLVPFYASRARKAGLSMHKFKRKIPIVIYYTNFDLLLIVLLVLLLVR